RLMERMLLVSGSMMNRRALALTIVLLLAGLAPASAIIGFCSRMPCCSHAADAAAAFSTERDDCCTTIACYESSSTELTTTPSSANAHPTAPVISSAAAVPAPAPLITQAFDDT